MEDRERRLVEKYLKEALCIRCPGKSDWQINVVYRASIKSFRKDGSGFEQKTVKLAMCLMAKDLTIE